MTGKHSSGKTFTISIDSSFTRDLVLDDGVWDFKAVAWDGNTGNFMGSPSCGSNTIDLKPDTLTINISLNADCTSSPVNMQALKILTCGTDQYVNADVYATITPATPDTYCSGLPTAFSATLIKYSDIKYEAIEIVDGVKTYPFESPCISTIPTLSTKQIPINYIPLSIKAYTSSANCASEIGATRFEFSEGLAQGSTAFQSVLETGPYRLVLPTAATKQFVAPPASPGWIKEVALNSVNADSNDFFGLSVSVHRDTMVVASSQEDSSQTTITNGATASLNNSFTDSGAVYVYKRSGTTWSQEAYIKASNAGASDLFGNAVSIHQDTLAVAANMEDSNQLTITNGSTASVDNTSLSAGAVYIYKRSGGNWVQEAFIKTLNAQAGDQFGSALQVHGETLVVSASQEDSNQTTITNGATASSDNSSSAAGAAYVYVRSGGNWSQEAYIKASNSGASDMFGYSVSLYQNTIAVGVQAEDSNQTTITNGTSSSSDNSSNSSGAVYVYKRAATSWAQEAYIKASNSDASDSFGVSVSLDYDRLAVGASGEDSNQITITNGATASSDNTLTDSGAVYVYKRTGSNWAQEAYIKASNADGADNFGSRVYINGNTLIVSAPTEDGNQTISTKGTSSDDTSADSGAVYVYKLGSSGWINEAYLKAYNNGAGDYFGSSIAVYGDTIVVGAYQEDGPSNALSNTGAVYVYRNTTRLFEPLELLVAATASSISLNWIPGGSTATGHVLDYQSGSTPPADCSSGTFIPSINNPTISGLNSATTYSGRVCSSDGTNDSVGVTFTITTL